MESFLRLAYVGDVPIEPTNGGSLLLWRLFSLWPKDRLQILEFTLSQRNTHEQLANTTTSSLPFSRLSRSRFRKIHSDFLLGSGIKRTIKKWITSQNPEAIISVAHGSSWMVAQDVAEELNLPFHLIVHDDFPSFHPSMFSEKRVRSNFLQRLSKSETVFCVSKPMRDAYKRLVPGNFTVLMPSQGPNQSDSAPIEPPVHSRECPNVVYAGSINSESIAKHLRAMAEAMERRNFGKLIIYSQAPDSSSLAHKRIDSRAMVPPSQTFSEFQDQADFLLLLMNFEESIRSNMEFCFPSKLVDYTATGKPIIFVGPIYGSGIQWGIQEIGKESVFTTPDYDRIVDHLVTLSKTPDEALALGNRCLEAGNRWFSLDKAFQTLCSINEN